MSAKSELKDLLDDLSEEQAREMLARLRPAPEDRPTFREMMRMTPAERAAVIARFPPLFEDDDEFRAWDAFDDFTDE